MTILNGYAVKWTILLPLLLRKIVAHSRKRETIEGQSRDNRGKGMIETRGPVSKLLLVDGDAGGLRTRVIYATQRDSGDRARRFSRERRDRETAGHRGAELP